MSKAIGYYVSVETLRDKRIGKGKEYVYDYQSETYPTKQLALKWAYHFLPVTKYGFLMRAHTDSDDDEMKGCLRYVRRTSGPALIFEDDGVVWGGKDYGNTYDVTANGGLKNRR